MSSRERSFRKNVQTSPIKTYSEGYRKLNEKNLYEQPEMHKHSETRALGSNRLISADNGSPVSSSGPTQFPTSSSSNETTESSEEPTALKVFVAVSSIILVIASSLLPTGWTYYHYGYWWCLIPAILSTLILVIINGLPYRICVFNILFMPKLALGLFAMLFSLPPTPCVDEKQFYGEWVHYSENYRDEDWKTREYTTIEIMPKSADSTTYKKRRMVRTRVTEIKLDKPPYMSEIKLKNYFDWHIEGDEIVFESNDIYTTESGTPYMHESEANGYAEVVFHGFDSKDYLHYEGATSGDLREFARGPNPYSSKKEHSGLA